ncbi:hypothetical protein HYPSUDRAFT_651490 [Hypholoma sublateritium FD-334 SS-4]|uniref:Uncharacterized protein n=1 Tax=Hypholoma sublateritium (strain FD-334 SS-4) TaxID=945553 RepID=A0A0D2L6E3_HYPSF|nr:hypothetical protein HYPSUDRAFT_651490 [Hypholoma sublateritium FD-334 SS-4]
MLRSRGGQYGICIDCDPTSSSAVFSSVNGFDASDQGNSAPVALYSTTFSSPGVHVITMRNEADSRGTPAGNSQLTLDRIVLQVAIPAITTTSQKVSLNPSPTTTSTTTSTSVTSSNNVESSSVASTSTVRSSTSISTSTASSPISCRRPLLEQVRALSLEETHRRSLRLLQVYHHHPRTLAALSVQ